MKKKAVTIADMLTLIQNSPMTRVVNAGTKWKTDFNLLPNHLIALGFEENARILNSYSTIVESSSRLKEHPIFAAAGELTNQRMLFDRALLDGLNYRMLAGSDINPSIFRELSQINNFRKTIASATRASILFKGLDLSAYNIQLDYPENIIVEDLELDVVGSSEPEKKIILLHEANRLRDTIHGIYRDNSLLYKLKPREFEEVVAELLRNKNFEVELTKQTRDGGFDLIAVQNLAGVPLRFLVECKRHRENRPIGVDIIRSFSNVIQNHDANMGLLFTTSYFSPDARQHAEQYMPYRLDFKDKQDILSWVKAYTDS